LSDVLVWGQMLILESDPQVWSFNVILVWSFRFILERDPASSIILKRRPWVRSKCDSWEWSASVILQRDPWKWSSSVILDQSPWAWGQSWALGSFAWESALGHLRTWTQRFNGNVLNDFCCPSSYMISRIFFDYLNPFSCFSCFYFLVSSCWQKEKRDRKVTK
jgi:hypothetical protein